MANYTYTHGAADNRTRLRFLLGDNRGIVGTFTGTNQAFSDEELDDLLLPALANGNIRIAARIALQSRLGRESLAAGVTIAQLDRLNYPLGGPDQIPALHLTTLDDGDDTGPPA